MKIKSLHIQNIGGISDLEIPFNDSFNILCGTNGVGKSTILECIAAPFVNSPHTKLRRKAGTEIGSCKISVELAGIIEARTYNVKSFEPNIAENQFASDTWERSAEILFFRALRDIAYRKLEGIPRDKVYDYGKSNMDYLFGINSDDFKGWFENRYLFNDNKEQNLSAIQRANYEIAKKCFNVLDNNVTFSKVEANSLEILVNTPQGEIYLEYLSAGYKSCLYILGGLIREIEYRFPNSIVSNEFSGVVLIDEVDLHLHPMWQAKLVQSLKEMFPRCQFIVATHSPSVIQFARAEEVIPLHINSDGKVAIKYVKLGKYGYQGWTIEEILKDVMGLESTLSPYFKEVVENFGKSIDNDDAYNARVNFRILDEMLHPSSAYRRLFEIQMAGLEE